MEHKGKICPKAGTSGPGSLPCCEWLTCHLFQQERLLQLGDIFALGICLFQLLPESEQLSGDYGMHHTRRLFYGPVEADLYFHVVVYAVYADYHNKVSKSDCFFSRWLDTIFGEPYEAYENHYDHRYSPVGSAVDSAVGNTDRRANATTAAACPWQWQHGTGSHQGAEDWNRNRMRQRGPPLTRWHLRKPQVTSTAGTVVEKSGAGSPQIRHVSVVSDAGRDGLRPDARHVACIHVHVNP
ncbi:hypothetical protein CMUS01_09023 [Colletotrichum musicola]|uniref:Protein kinase domain-containing protein n=1 Tax=Colletotrichum musicola TaxID=2175873 RepID=A0A8H6NCB8_9PEZI|nr:hypothetical protein CMUS01_09023 [Colletotrichum musicola]